MRNALGLGGFQKDFHGVHAAVDRGIESCTGRCKLSDDLTAFIIDTDNLADVRFNLTADHNVQFAQLLRIALPDPRTYKKIRLRIKADNLDFYGAAVSFQGGKEHLRCGDLHALDFPDTGQIIRVHIKSPCRSLQQHILKAHL